MFLQDKIRNAERELATIDFLAAKHRLRRVLDGMKDKIYHATYPYRKYGTDITLYSGLMSETYGSAGLHLGADTFTLGAELSIKDGGYHIRDPLGDFRDFIAYDDFEARPLTNLFEQQFGDQIVEIFKEKARKRLDF